MRSGWIAIGLVTAACVLPVGALAQESTPSASASARVAAAAAAGLSQAELEKMMTPLGSDAVEQRRAAAGAILALGTDAVPAMSQKLTELRRAGPGVFNVLKAIRDRKETGDLLDVLVAQRHDAATQRTLSIVCLLRALAHVGTTPAVKQLVPLASDAGGTLRPELSRQMKQLGERAVPALIEARRDSSQETRTWALTLLESMNKRTPGDAVQTNDNQVLADVLAAYADIKDLDALPVVLSFVNSDRTQVRAAAREATLAYGADATWRLREAYAVLTGEQAPEGMPAADLAKKLFGAYDHYRLHEVYTLLDDGLAKQKDGKLEEAVKAFDEVLARQPMLDRRGEMASAYAAWGEWLESTDRAKALDALRKALRLDEAGPQSSHVRSEIRTLEGEDLVARGIADVQPFEEALALDPQNAHARDDLDRLHAEEQSSRSRTYRIVAAAAVFVAAVAAIFFVGGRRRRARAAA